MSLICFFGVARKHDLSYQEKLPNDADYLPDTVDDSKLNRVMMNQESDIGNSGDEPTSKAAYPKPNQPLFETPFRVRFLIQCDSFLITSIEGQLQALLIIVRFFISHFF